MEMVRRYHWGSMQMSRCRKFLAQNVMFERYTAVAIVHERGGKQGKAPRLAPLSHISRPRRGNRGALTVYFACYSTHQYGRSRTQPSRDLMIGSDVRDAALGRRTPLLALPHDEREAIALTAKGPSVSF